MTRNPVALVALVVALVGIPLMRASLEARAANTVKKTAAAPANGPRRALIVPRVDHHQHLVGPTAASPPPAALPEVTLPPDLQRVLDERNRAMGGEPGDLYAPDAVILDATEEGQPWVTGAEAVKSILATYRPGAQLVANAYTRGDAAASVSGVVKGSSGAIRLNFSLGLKKDAGGAWRIASEQTTRIPERAFEKPITGDQLVRMMDEAGIERSVVLSVAYWFGSPNSTRAGVELDNVRAENDWTAGEVKKHADRLVFFCGVSPLKDYAAGEIRRCAKDLGAKGLKLHFRSSRVDVKNPEHLAKVKEIFRLANELGLAIVVHSRQAGAYGREHAEIFMKEVLPMAPDVPVQIAHLWGGNEYNAEALAVFAEAVAGKDPRAKNLWFDLTEIEPNSTDEELQVIAQRIRQIGPRRVVYGSDAATTAEGLEPVSRWAKLRRRLPLSDAELRIVAENVAPYVK